MNYQEIIANLTQQLVKYNNAYYNNNQSLVTDDEYDKLFQQLIALESQYPQYKLAYSPTRVVGHTPDNKFEHVTHVIPMLSLNNIFSDDKHTDLIRFNNRICDNLSISNVEYVALLKYDGIAISLIYESGVLMRAVTRGDGFTGELVTHNARIIDNIPYVLSDKVNIEIRGEAVMLFDEFHKLNSQQLTLKQKTFANPRNAASGTIRQLVVQGNRKLHFFAYAMFAEHSFKSFNEQLLYLENLGFTTGQQWQVTSNNVSDLICHYQHILSIRTAIPFGIDGLVYKVNDIAMQHELGYVNRAPRFAIAHKFPSALVKAQIIDIQVQVGRTGVLTPVAVISPTQIDGVIVRRASLHNYDEIVRQDICINDFVWLKRAGDVIPDIVSVVILDRPDNAVHFKMPLCCPDCGTLLIRVKDEIALRCPAGMRCTTQKKQTIMHFVSKLGLNIAGLNIKTINQLVDLYLIDNTADIYRLTAEHLMQLKGFAKKSIDNLLRSINDSKQTTLARFIYALGIRHVGEKTAKDLANRFGVIETLMHASLAELTAIHDIGDVVALSIVEFFSDDSNISNVKRLLEYGVVIIDSVTQSSPISGLYFVITGVLPNFTRSQIKGLIESHGGYCIDSISRRTDYLVAGDNPGSKLAQADKLGVKVIGEDGLLRLMTVKV